MPDSKGELKRYATKYKIETGQHWFVNPVCHGERGFATDDFLGWLASALSTAEQRIEELEKTQAFLLRLSTEGGCIVSSAAASEMEIAWNRAQGFWHQIGSLGFSLRQPEFLEHVKKLENGANKLSCAFCGHTEDKAPEETVKDRMIAHIVECEEHPLNKMSIALSKAEATIAELRGEREKELREAWEAARKFLPLENTYWASDASSFNEFCNRKSEEAFRAFLAQKEGK